MTRLESALAELAAALLAEVREEVSRGTSAPDRLLSVDEAAAMLGIGRTRLYGEIQAGRLRSISSGRRRHVPASAITAYIAERAAS